MEVIHARCAGLDVHKDSVQVTVRLAEGNRVQRHKEGFHATTSELLRLREWLVRHAVTHVAMEATGVYWSQSGTCSRGRFNWCWETRKRSEMCRVASPT